MIKYMPFFITILTGFASVLGFIIQALLICLILNCLFTVFYIMKPTITYRLLN